jgi:hypothetical protein
VANFAKVIVISLAMMTSLLVILFLVTGASKAIVPILELTAACGVLISMLMLLVILVVFRNRMHMAFSVNEDEALAATIDRRGRAGVATATMMGAVSGKPGLAGVGLLASASSAQRVPWSAVRHVYYSPRWRTIKLDNSWRTVVILFCTEANYESVAEHVRTAVATAPKILRPNPVPRLLLLSLLTVIASLPMFGLPSPVRIDTFIPFVVLCFALTSLWFLPVFGWVVIGGLAWVFLNAAATASAPFMSMFTQETHARIGLMDMDDWIEVGIACAGAAYLV